MTLIMYLIVSALRGKGITNFESSDICTGVHCQDLFMDIMAAKAAKDLSWEMSVPKPIPLLIADLIYQ
jgi:hypothetical protein